MDKSFIIFLEKLGREFILQNEQGAYVMFYLPRSELLFYGGLAAMGVAAILAVLGIVIFTFTGRKLKKILEQEYGEPKRIDLHGSGGKRECPK